MTEPDEKPCAHVWRYTSNLRRDVCEECGMLGGRPLDLAPLMKRSQDVVTAALAVCTQLDEAEKTRGLVWLPLEVADALEELRRARAALRVELELQAATDPS